MRTLLIYALSIHVTWRILTLVDVLAAIAVSIKTFVACAGEITGRVCAYGILVAHVAAITTFINIDTFDAIANESEHALALETARQIFTNSPRLTVMGTVGALIDI